MHEPYPLTPLILSLIQRIITQTSTPVHWDTVFDEYRQDPEDRAVMLAGLATHLLDRYPTAFNLKFIPVTPAEFLLSRAYLDKSEEVYPRLIPEFMEMNSGDYVEILLTGAIGVAKSTLALWSTAYQLYLLSAYKNPQREFALESASEILFVFQSINKVLAKAVDFDRFKATVELSPYFQRVFPYDKDLSSQLVFPNRIIVKPISGSSTGAIGQNVFGGLLEEVNFMDVTEHSKRSVDQGVYDQAIELYNALARRRKSRFMKLGRVPGLFCIVSSKRYPGQFTDVKEQESRDELRKTGTTTIYVYDKRTWDVLPADRFSGQWFMVFIGDESRRPRILDEDEALPDSDAQLVIEVPVEYRVEFERDIMNALRDIAGVSTLALFPFFQSREHVAAMFGYHESILSASETDFMNPPIKILPSRFWRPELPRWIHIDLSLRKDSTGMACACVPGFTAINRGDGPEDYETLPQFRYDFQLAIKAPKGGEILYYKIRSLIYALREHGLNIRWISFDSYQSTDMIQVLRQNNFITGELSMDTSTLPYETLKSACYDGRVMAPMHRLCENELVALEMDPKMKKIDHPPTGSKDCADAMAGACHGLTMRRETWVAFDVPIVRMPTSFKELMVKEKDRMKELGQSPCN